MKQYLLFFALAISLSAKAQITIESTDMPVGGDIYTMATANPASITVADAQQNGANQTWNYSLTATSQAQDTAYAINKVPFIFEAIFYSSTFADQLAPNINIGSFLSITDIYSFYSVSTSKMEQTGTGATISGLPAPSIYNPRDEVYLFPMNYGDADSCNFAFNDSLPSIGRWIETGTRVNHVDGWGTLNTPLGPKNVLRVHADLNYEDSIYVSAFSFGIKIPRQQIEYKWLAKNGGLPMLQVVTTVTGGTETITQVLYRDTMKSAPSSVANIPYNDNIRVYPQPADNNFIISSSGDVINTACIYDLCGRVIKRINGIGQTFMNISTSDIPTGLYPVVLQGRNKNYTVKISVIH